ncbi:MAG: D-ribose pyranase [Lachnospiraceae bacterium]
MKAYGILNKNLMTAIADMGHEDIMIIGDVGVPIAQERQRIDLAITQDLPSIRTILGLIMNEMIYEKVVVAEEQKKYNPVHYGQVEALSKRCKVETMPHRELFDTYLPQAKYIVRTGGFEPWGNIVLAAGIDAPKWFEKEGCIIPDYYEERANYEEEE